MTASGKVPKVLMRQMEIEAETWRPSRKSKPPENGGRALQV